MFLANPILLWALLLIAIPVAIHLFLRVRPRTVVFPPLRLLRTALMRGEQARRLRDRLLLGVRIALVALIAVALSRPGCRADAGAGASGEPLAVALVIDDSLSMSYRGQFDAEETLLDDALAAARSWIDQVPPLSRPSVTVIRASDPGAARGLVGDRAAILDALRTVSTVPHARPLGAALKVAAESLRPAGDTERQIMVFTDGAASAWRDVSGGVLTGLDGCQVDVIAVGPQTPRDIRVAARLTSRVIASQARVPIAVRVISTGAEVTGAVIARNPAGETLARFGPLATAADSTVDTVAPLPPRGPGTHAAILTVEPPDLLDGNQHQYVVWQARPTPIVHLAGGSDSGTDDSTALLIANLLAPAGAPEELQRVALRHGLPATRNDPATMLVLLPGMTLDANTESATLGAVEHGAALVLAPAGDSAALDWPSLRRLISEDAPRVESLSSPVSIARERHAEPDDPLAGLAGVEVRRRVRFASLTSDAAVAARYSDGVAAVIERRISRGRVLLLTTSPAPEWSDFGKRAGGLIGWLHAVIDQAADPASDTLSLVAGAASTHRFASLPPAGVVSVVREDDVGPPPVWIRLADGRPTEPWPTLVAGVYAIRADGVVRARYAVNWPDEEWDLTRATLEQLIARLGTRRVRIATSVDQLAPHRAGGIMSFANVVALLSLVGIALLLADSWLSATRGARR